MPNSETAGLLSAWKENAQVSLGAENVLLGTDDENVPLSLYEMMLALADTEQRAKTGNNSFTLFFIVFQSTCNQGLPSSTDFGRKVLLAKDGKKDGVSPDTVFRRMDGYLTKSPARDRGSSMR